jgi:hypothetical protein
MRYKVLYISIFNAVQVVSEAVEERSFGKELIINHPYTKTPTNLFWDL